MTIDYISVSLDDILKEWGSENAERLLKTFKCDRDPEMEEFLMDKARLFHKKHLSRTYLFLTKDRRSIIAYLTVGIKCLKIPKENQISSKIKNEMNTHKGVTQTYLIGQLCKANGAESGIGPKLIEFALEMFNKSFKSIGCRVVRVDCKLALRDFYERNGFRMVSQEEDGGELHHMVLLLS